MAQVGIACSAGWVFPLAQFRSNLCFPHHENFSRVSVSFPRHAGVRRLSGGGHAETEMPVHIGNVNLCLTAPDSYPTPRS